MISPPNVPAHIDPTMGDLVQREYIPLKLGVMQESVCVK